MDLSLSAEQQMLQDSVSRFVQNDYDFQKRSRLVAAGLGGSPDTWRIFAVNGWLTAGFPEDFGGFGEGAIETALISQQLGRGLVVEPWLGSAVLATRTFLAAGSAAQLVEWLPSLGDGSLRLALAYGEAQSRGLPHIVAARADREGEGWRINGKKNLVLGAAGADAFVVSARTEGDLESRRGIGLFLVAADAPGLSVVPVRLCDGSVAAEVSLAAVPAVTLGDPTDGLIALEHGLAHAVSALCAELVGGMERSIEISAEYLRTRKQFGVPIATFQSLQHRLADMAAEMELARSMLFVALASIENDDVDTRRAVLSGAKAFITTAARNVCGQGIQLHGAIGMTEECAIGHYFVRAVVADAVLGGRSVHHAVCAEALQKRFVSKVRGGNA